MPGPFCELDRATAQPERAVIFAAEFVVWWRQAGRFFYGPGGRERDDGLRSFATEAVTVLGGWRAARRTIRSAELVPKP